MGLLRGLAGHPAHPPFTDAAIGAYAAANEISRGKDTPSGHWEIAGTPVRFDWGYFPTEGDAFSEELVAEICAAGDLPGILGNRHASGTEIIAELGEEHISTGKPICLLSLANDPPGADALALKVKPGCDASVVRFGPASWHMSQGELILLSARGQTWRFEQNDANTWQRVPEGANPILLVRQ